MSNPRDCWETPDWLFQKLDRLYHFTLDACANATNHKCLVWHEGDGPPDPNTHWWGRVFCNPPYSNISPWVEKAIREWPSCELIVMLLPSRTDQAWFHQLRQVADIHFIKGRIQFVPPPGVKKSSNREASIIAVFKPFGNSAEYNALGSAKGSDNE